MRLRARLIRSTLENVMNITTSKRALVVALLGLGAIGQYAMAEDLVVKIGLAAPLTGPSAHQGKDLEHGVELAVEEANAKKLVIGGKVAKFQLVSEDDQGDPKIGTQVAQRLVDNNVSVVIGHYNSGTSIPASRIYAEAGIPQISPAATNPMLTNQGFSSVFRTVNDDSALGKYAGTFIVSELKAKRIAIIDDRTAYGQGLADGVVKAIKAAKGNVAKREFTNDKAVDFSSILTACKSVNADLIFFAGQDFQAATIVKQMKNLGIKATFMNIGGNLPNDNFDKLAGSAAEGMYAWNYGLPLTNMPRGVAFNSTLKAKYGVGVISSSPFAYDATWAAIAAMVKAKSVVPAKYLSELKKISYDGVTGKIAFDSRGDLKNAAATVFQFKGGKWKTLAVKRGVN